MTDLVTGEAVVLELRLAKLASRALSVGIDVALQIGLLVGGLLLIGGLAGQVDAALGAALALVTVVLVLVGYPVACETLTRGRTLGKVLLGLRVVRDDGGPIRFRHALVRGLLAVVEIYATAGAIALVASLSSQQGKRVGDFLAGTVVVRERVPVQGAPLALMPPPLAGWAAGLDLSRVPDDLALAARQLLARAPELAPEVRDAMAGRLAGELARVTTPAPPPGTPALPFLAAVVAERRQRESARLGTPTGRPYAAAPPPPYAAAPAPPPAPAAPAPAAPAPAAPAPAAPAPAAPAPERPAPEQPRADGPFAPPG